MPNVNEITRGVYGAWRLAQLDTGGVAYFDQTAEGFWKSFFAAAIVAPGYVILVLIALAEHGVEAGFLRVFLIHASAYAIGWTAYPLAMHHICGATGKRAEYIGFIVAFNWAQVIQMMVYLPVFILAAMDILPREAIVIVYFVVLAYQWFVTRTMLGINAMNAVMLIVLDQVISIVLSATAENMLG